LVNIATILGIPIAIWTLKADHERQKKQSTVEFDREISSIAVDLQNQIKDIFHDDVINPNDERYDKNNNIQNIIKNYLSLMEQFSLGINMGIYDITTYIRLSGRTTTNWYNQLKEIINDNRNKNSQPSLYIEFEMMVEKINKKTPKMNNTSGNIWLG